MVYFCRHILIYMILNLTFEIKEFPMLMSSKECVPNLGPQKERGLKLSRPEINTRHYTRHLHRRTRNTHTVQIQIHTTKYKALNAPLAQTYYMTTLHGPIH